MTKLIPLDQLKAMCAEIERREASLPLGDWGTLPDLREQLAQGRRTADAFLTFRQQIEGAEI
ncbi:MAG: hypothetical protein WBV94_18535 [Blastocatellia bacterium]